MGPQVTFQVGDYRTLPCHYVHARVLEDMSKFQPSSQCKPEYAEPTIGEYPFELSRECLSRASTDADYAISVLDAWLRHESDIGYYWQFHDDSDASLIKRYHSHTELVAAIITERLKWDDQAIHATFMWMKDFRWVQMQYRADPKRNERYQQHADELARKSKKSKHDDKAGALVHKAIRYIKLQREEWPRLPPILNIVSKAKEGGQLSLFYSYSHKDEGLRDELEKHLSGLQRSGKITQWHDRQIGAGEEWRGQIDEHLKAADIILLLISSDFLASNYCYDVEMSEAMRRHDAKEARVIPVFLRQCDWDGSPFGKLQGLPTDAKAVTSWDNQDEAFTDVAKGIRSAITDMVLSRKG